jgi:outer membrane protein TolC
MALWLAGCADSNQPSAAAISANAGANRRMQLWQTTTRPARKPSPLIIRSTPRPPATTRPAATRPSPGGPLATQPVATRPAGAPPVSTQPAAAWPEAVTGPLIQPYHLNTVNVVRLLYQKSPLVIASREEMIAARYGLEEFRTNLSRFEPYARADGTASHFPERRGAQGAEGEVVGGLEKETFDGAVVSVEGGVSASRFHFDETDDEPAEVSAGSGTVVRARLEVPFVGSRKRQNRVINQAYQESTARAAVLQYLSEYRSYATSAFTYHAQTLLYLHYIRAYENQIATLEALLKQPRLPAPDRIVVQNALGDARVVRDGYEANYWTSLLSLLEYLGIKPEEKYVLDDLSEPPLRYRQRVNTPEGLQELLTQAFANNPRFAVLEDAIRNADFRKTQALLGKLDITAFLEGTQFPFGALDFDDRVRGWQITAGVTVRLNDPRVLTEAIKKAEAQIRQYQAQIEAEQADIRDQIAIRADRLRSLHQSRSQILENIDQARTEFEERCERYFSGKPSRLTIDDVLTPLYLVTDSEVKLASNLNQIIDAESDLMTSTGEVYRLVGLRIENRGHGMELFEENLPADNQVVSKR